jgi:hypothetical protein
MEALFVAKQASYKPPVLLGQVDSDVRVGEREGSKIGKKLF